jgi:hypothetical protein
VIAWAPLNARARGLATRLLDRDALETLARLEPEPLAARLGGEAAGPGPLAIERAVRHRAAAILAVLSRWAGDRREALAVVFEEEDLRSVRRLVRGAAGGAPPEHRLAGLVPTPTLPADALADAAEAGSPAEAMVRLAQAGHPDADALAATAAGLAPDLFRLEVELARGAAHRMIRAARQGGPRLAGYARRSIDLGNAWSALSADAWVAEVDPDEVYVAGGGAIDGGGFATVVGLDSPDTRRRALARAFAGGPLARVFADPAIPLSDLERSALAVCIEDERRARRLDPLGAAPFLELVLRLRAQVRDLQAVLWGAALTAPSSAVSATLATP